MKYKIFELTKPNDLCLEAGNWGRTEEWRTVLVEISIDGMVTMHDTLEQAFAEIEKFKPQLSRFELTVIPFISIK